VSAPLLRRAHILLVMAVFGLACLGTASMTVISSPAGAADRLSWRRCPGDPTFDCATLVVPLDHAKPNGPTLSLAVRRLKALKPRQKIGSLVVNPGGPGGSGLDFIRRANGAFGTQLRDRFDLVSWDPRGVGASSPVRCGTSAATLEQFLTLDPEPENREEVAEFSRVTDAFTAGCLQISGADLLRNVDTESTVRDLEMLRRALGEPLTYMGFSYGTLIGAIYADLYPKQVRAMVLDGALDPSMGIDDRAFDQAKGFQQALELWSDTCRSDAACRRALGDDPVAWVDRFLETVDDKPLDVKSRKLDLSSALYGVVAGLYSPKSGWPALREALVEASKGSGARLLSLADGYNNRNRDGTYANTIEANIAVNCADSSSESTVEHYESIAKKFDQVSPVFGAAVAWSGLSCGRWKVPSKNILKPRTAAGSVPIVVIGTTQDPATPLAWARTTAATLNNGVLIEYDGVGHTAYLRGGPCLRRIVERYLVSVSVGPKKVSVSPEGSCPLSSSGKWSASSP
jgi:pimeloyl-ACP methyl ester carboxylesterase